MRLFGFDYLEKRFKVSLRRSIEWDRPNLDAVSNSLAALEVPRILYPILRPSAVDVILACRHRKVPELVLGNRPKKVAYRLQRTGGPHYEINLIPHREAFLSSIAEDIDDTALAAWLAAALQQAPPDEDSLVVLEQISCRDNSCRLSSITDGEPAPEARLQSKGGPDVSVSLSRHEGGLWVSSPGPGYAGNPPIEFDVGMEDEQLVATIEAAWTPWADLHSSQHRELLAALDELSATGWRLMED